MLQLGYCVQNGFSDGIKGDRVTSKETTALIHAMGDGGVQVGKADGIEVDSILEEESIRLADALNMVYWLEERQRLNNSST